MKTVLKSVLGLLYCQQVIISFGGKVIGASRGIWSNDFILGAKIPMIYALWTFWMLPKTKATKQEFVIR